MIRTLPKYPTYTDESSGRNTPTFVLALDLVVSVPDWTFPYMVTIPSGFATDFGSIPKSFRNLITSVSVYDSAYLLHDYQYSKSYTGPEISFTQSNKMLRANLRALGMSKFDAFLVFWSVQLFGKKRWRVSV